MIANGKDLAREYARVCGEPSDIYEHLPTFVRLVAETDAENVIELGTRTGVSTIAWLYGLAGTDGHLWSVDIDTRPDIGTYDHWTFIQGDDLAAETIDQLPVQADIVFIDTSHAYDQTLRELNTYRWFVKPGGKLVLHDTELPQPIDVGPQPSFPVKRAIQEFCAAEGLSWENDPKCWGLGIVDVP